MDDRERKPDNRNNKNNRNNKKPNFQLYVILAIVAAVTIALITGLDSLVKSSTTKKVTYDEFVAAVEEGNVDTVKISSSRVTFTLKNDLRMTYYTPYLPDSNLLPMLNEAGVEYTGTEDSSGSAIIEFILMYILPFALIWILMGFLMRRIGGGSGGMMGIGKANTATNMSRATGVTFADVAGEDEAKESLTEIVDFLHNPQKYVQIGAKLPKGALLVGPPGTGKTLLARAVAGEAKVPFFSLSGSDFVEMFVGVGASRVRDLFKTAQQNAPCIIFIDEIDAIGKTRDTRYGGNDEREQTLNQLLSEMDGFDASKGVLVMAATNRPEILDKALLRPGRFDRRVIVDKPDLKGRIAILKVHAKDVRMDDSVDLEAIALATSGAVGSDLANMINEAAITAVKRGSQVVSQKDLLEAVEVVLVGKEKKDRVMNQKERRIVSYHEVGHALIGALQKDSEPVQKITIVPRTMGALGYVMQTPAEEKFLNSKEEIMNMVVMALGGRAAEELVFNSVTTGAANDIEQATAYVRNMITMYGMSDEFGLMALETVENQYLDGRKVLNCADATAAQIDQVVKETLKKCYEQAKQMLSENREVMDHLAEFLIKEETITGKEFMEIFHKYRLEQMEHQVGMDTALAADSQEKTDSPSPVSLKKTEAASEIAPETASEVTPKTTTGDSPIADSSDNTNE